MWQKHHEELAGDDFTIVGLALDAEGVAPAKKYYDRFGVTFPSLVDPNYATQFGAVPKTFLIDEHGVVVSTTKWQEALEELPDLRPVTEDIRRQFSSGSRRLDSAAIKELAEQFEQSPNNYTLAADLMSRHIDLGQHEEALVIGEVSIEDVRPRVIAQNGGNRARELAQLYLQLARASASNRDKQVAYATLSFYLNPTVGFGKQIARMIAPEKFDDRPDGSFDNSFREGTLRRLKNERRVWLGESRAP